METTTVPETKKRRFVNKKNIVITTVSALVGVAALAVTKGKKGTSTPSAE